MFRLRGIEESTVVDIAKAESPELIINKSAQTPDKTVKVKEESKLQR